MCHGSPLFDVKVLPHFYAPPLLDIHVWAHKLPVTKKSCAVHRSLHCGWQCRTNTSPCAETKFCNPNGLPTGGDREVTPITPAASSWILLLLDTFTTKCRTPQLSLPSSPIRFSILWSFPLLLTPSSLQNRCPIYTKSEWVNLNESTINEWKNENRSALQKGACASVRHAPKSSQHCLKFHQGTQHKPHQHHSAFSEMTSSPSLALAAQIRCTPSSKVPPSYKLCNLGQVT